MRIVLVVVALVLVAAPAPAITQAEIDRAASGAHNGLRTVIKKLAALKTSDSDKAELVAEQLLDNALIAAGLLEDPSRMIARLNKLLESV